MSPGESDSVAHNIIHNPYSILHNISSILHVHKSPGEKAPINNNTNNTNNSNNINNSNINNNPNNTNNSNNYPNLILPSKYFSLILQYILKKKT